jgi:hypothetical protein
MPPRCQWVSVSRTAPSRASQGRPRSCRSAVIGSAARRRVARAAPQRRQPRPVLASARTPARRPPAPGPRRRTGAGDRKPQDDQPRVGGAVEADKLVVVGHASWPWAAGIDPVHHRTCGRVPPPGDRDMPVTRRGAAHRRAGMPGLARRCGQTPERQPGLGQSAAEGPQDRYGRWIAAGHPLHACQRRARMAAGSGGAQPRCRPARGLGLLPGMGRRHQHCQQRQVGRCQHGAPHLGSRRGAY